VSAPRPQTSQIPDQPGAYLFRDGDGRVVYIGKARSLRKRLASYWGKPLHPRTEAMVAAARSVEWIVASTEVDALMLEYNLIQEHRPRFNIRYRDDKSYPYLALTVGERWPRAQVLRGTKRKRVRYFGPFGHAYAIRETLDALTRVFPVRTCSNAFFDQRARARRPCLYYDIGRCSGPCVPEATGVTEETYRADVEALAAFLAGNERPVLARLEREMRQAAERQEYELAAKLRDQLRAARRALEHQEMVLTQPEDLDVIALAEDDLEAAFQGFFVRRGRVMGRKGWIVDRVEELDRSQLIGSFVRELYMERQDVPPRVLVPELPEGADVLAAWLSERRGGRVSIAVPERGAKRKLMETVAQNARDHFVRHKLKRASDFGARSRALAELGAVLGLEQAPLRIECYDISNLGPTDVVARWWCSRTGCPSARTTGASRSGASGGRTTSPAWRRCSAAGSLASGPRPIRITRDRSGSRIPPRSSWSTAAGGSSRSRRRCSPTPASTSPRSAWRSDSRRSTSRTGPTRCSCRGGRRPSSCSSTCATRPIGSR
jgi:excinuclease ABC subunit C